MRPLLPSALLLAAACAVGASERPPNIVLILADDMGWSDLGCMGSEIATPNLDGLARRGALMPTFYNCAKCGPTRAALLTGLYPAQARVGDSSDLRPATVTIPEALAQAGFRSFISGKWHLGANPLGRGFEHGFIFLQGATSYWRPKDLYLDQSPTALPEGAYLTDAITEHAVRFVQEASSGDRPYFLYLAYTAPHWPLHARPEDIAKYRETYAKGPEAMRGGRLARQVELGLMPLGTALPANDRQGAADPLAMAVYAAQVDCLDRNVGRVLAAIKAGGQEERTAILFLSDNGASAESSLQGGKKGVPGGPDAFVSYGSTWAGLSNAPLRDYKLSSYEGGIRTPLIAVWPGRIPAGSRRDGVGHVIDLWPTCLELAGLPQPVARPGQPAPPPREGRSLLPHLVAGTTLRGEEDLLCWQFRKSSGVRAGRWKAVGDGKRWALFDVAADPTESSDRSAEEAERLSRLRQAHVAWASRTGTQLP